MEQHLSKGYYKIYSIMASFSFILILLLLRMKWAQSTYDLTIVDVKICGWISIACILFVIYTQYKVFGQLFNLLTIFTVAIYVFSNGELALAALNIPYSELNAFYWGRFSDYEIVMAGVYNTLSLLALNIGIIMAIRKKKVNSNATIIQKEPISNSMLKAMKIVGFFLIMISIPFDLHDKITMVMNSSKHGYLFLYSENYSGINSIMSTLTLFCIPGCFLLSLSYKKSKLKKWIPLGYLIFRSLLILYAGKRGQAIALLVAMTWFVYVNFKKPNKKNSFKLVLLGYLSLVTMSTIVQYRSTINKTILGGFNVFLSELINISVVKDLLNEMGFSIRPLLELMKYNKGGIITPQYGMTYIFSLIMIIPSFLRGSLYSIGESKGWLGVEDWLTASVGASYGLGFSIQAESYYNFGENGWLFLVVFGWIICRLMISNSKVEETRVMKTAFNATLLALLIIFARSSTQLLFKYIIYYYAMPLLLLRVIEKNIRKVVQ